MLFRRRCSELFPYPTLFRSLRDLQPVADLRQLQLVVRAELRHVSIAAAGVGTPPDLDGPAVHVDDPGDRHAALAVVGRLGPDRKSTRLNSSSLVISYAVLCL